MNCSVDSPSSWLRQLNRAHLKITFFRTLEKGVELGNHRCVPTLICTGDSVDASVSFALSPMQETNVLICRLPSFAVRPDAGETVQLPFPPRPFVRSPEIEWGEGLQTYASHPTSNTM